MVPGLDVIAMTGLLTLAANPVQCAVPKAPVVTVTPKTSAIRYDHSKSLKELGSIKADTISPYGEHAEQLMFGLHRGKMQISARTRMGYATYHDLGVVCTYFDEVDVEIRLDPVIYIVNELEPDSCAYNAVLEHEKKHVAVDRDIANKYAREIGIAVQTAINKAGALGPYPDNMTDDLQKRMSDYVSSAISSEDLLLSEEQARRQQEVDSLQEYDRVGDVIRNGCHYKIEKEMKDSISALKGKSR